jgi:hypothetical protein
MTMCRQALWSARDLLRLKPACWTRIFVSTASFIRSRRIMLTNLSGTNRSIPPSGILSVTAWEGYLFPTPRVFSSSHILKRFTQDHNCCLWICFDGFSWYLVRFCLSFLMLFCTLFFLYSIFFDFVILLILCYSCPACTDAFFLFF